jgi:hypothetical protein
MAAVKVIYGHGCHLWDVSSLQQDLREQRDVRTHPGTYVPGSPDSRVLRGADGTAGPTYRSVPTCYWGESI